MLNKCAFSARERLTGCGLFRLHAHVPLDLRSFYAKRGSAKQVDEAIRAQSVVRYLFLGTNCYRLNGSKKYGACEVCGRPFEISPQVARTQG